MRLSGNRTAGPYCIVDGSSHQFSFNPITNKPNDPKWVEFCSQFSSFAKEHGGRCSLNQTLCLENDTSYGSTALSVTPSERLFATPWLQQFSS